MMRFARWAGGGGGAAALLAALFIWAATVAAASDGKTIDYLYVQPNEGDSSGGHVALRFGNEIFHFQHEPPGILRLQRNDSPAFYHAYAMLGNRSIRESRIAVSDDTYTLLRGAFVRLQLIQGAQLEIRDALHRDVALFDLLLRRQREENGAASVTLPLSPLGYFFPDPPPRHSPPLPDRSRSGALVSLRKRIETAYGGNFITEKIVATRTTLRGLSLHSTGTGVTAIARDVFPPFVATVSTQFQEASRGLLALELLQGAPQLRRDAVWTPQGELFRLEPQERGALERYAAQLEDELVALAGSGRSDWGFAFLLGMARLAAIEETLTSGRLVLLDVFNPESYLPPRHDAALRPYLPVMEREMRELFMLKRREFFSAQAMREADYAAMERSGNLLLDVERGMATGRPLRAVPKTAFPSREAPAAVPAPRVPDEAALERELDAARAREREYEALLARLYGYDLLRRNCVTALFDVVNDSMAGGKDEAGGGAPPADDGKERLRKESQRRLGGYIDPARGLAFIPLVSADWVQNSYAVVDSRELPSYRTARLAEMKRREGPVKVFLRESNTVTSSIYRPGPEDSAFLFFTDDTVLFRPIFGAFNLLAGVGESLVGIFTLPAEGPERVIAGARGIVFSLPELLFVNLRKGSMAFVENSADSPGAIPDTIP